MAWEVYGEGGGEFTNLKDARQCAREFSTQGSDLDGYGTPGEVSIWKDGTLFMTYNNGKLVYDGWTIKNYKYNVKNLETLEEETVVVSTKLKLDRVYTLSDGRRIQPLRLLTTKDKEGVKDSSNDEVNSYVPPKQEYKIAQSDNTEEEEGISLNKNESYNSMNLKKLKECLHTEILDEAFKVNKELNPNLFNNSTGEMHNDVRVRLCEIADMFVENIQEDEVPIKVYDYWLVGSNAAYNYSPESDIDVHIIVDMEETKVNPYLLRLLYDYIKSSFNDKYDIMVKGHEVELYLEDIKTSAVTNGIYSLKQAKWIKQPEKQEEREYSIEDSELYSIVYDRYINLRDEDAEEFLDDLYVMRKESLVADGEFGEGNLVFKQFRNNGYIDDIKEKKYKFKSQELTLEQLNTKDLNESGDYEVTFSNKSGDRERVRIGGMRNVDDAHDKALTLPQASKYDRLDTKEIEDGMCGYSVFTIADQYDGRGRKMGTQELYLVFKANNEREVRQYYMNTYFGKWYDGNYFKQGRPLSDQMPKGSDVCLRLGRIIDIHQTATNPQIYNRYEDATTSSR